MTPEERVQVVPTWQPELATCNMGSINFALYPAARHFSSEDYQFDWEEEYLKASEDVIFPNTFRSIKTFLKFMKDNNTRPEFEVYDVGHLYNMKHLIDLGLIATPVWMQFVMGVLGGIQPTIPDLVHLINTADRVIGRDNYNWSVIGVGYPHEFELGTVMCASASRTIYLYAASNGQQTGNLLNGCRESRENSSVNLLLRMMFVHS